jgi:hypothetical protein
MMFFLSNISSLVVFFCILGKSGTFSICRETQGVSQKQNGCFNLFVSQPQADPGKVYK